MAGVDKCSEVLIRIFREPTCELMELSAQDIYMYLNDWFVDLLSEFLITLLREVDYEAHEELVAYALYQCGLCGTPLGCHLPSSGVSPMTDHFVDTPTAIE